MLHVVGPSIKWKLYFPKIGFVDFKWSNNMNAPKGTGSDSLVFFSFGIKGKCRTPYEEPLPFDTKGWLLDLLAPVSVFSSSPLPCKAEPLAKWHIKVWT